MKRGKFSLSHYKLLTTKMGVLTPVTWFEALPGDTIQHATSALVRAAPLVAPVMHPVHVRFHHFFVPLRIIWTNWENFITGGSDGLDATAHPYITITNPGVSKSTLGDYLGAPTTGLAASLKVSALPYRAYAMIFNEFYRDEDLVSALALSLGDGSDSTTNTTIQNVAWEKDYLTSSRPWEQKGPSISVPVGGQAPITGLGVLAASASVAGPSGNVKETGGGTTTYPNYNVVGTNPASGTYMSMSASGVGANPQVFANLAAASGVDINVVRHAFAMQRWQEARARYGSRYVEYLRYLGIKSSDARLQRPEYLGGGRSTLQFSEVLQTAPTNTTAGGAGGIGQFGGHGITAIRSNRYRRFFEEHGIVMTLMSIRPRTMYSQRVKRAWLRGQTYNGMVGTKEDYWQRELQHIGQQQVAGYEADSSVGNVVFGYQDRYDEYRREESSVAGNFRDSVLDQWHYSREFGSAPSLNSTFVQCVPSTRTFADTSSDNVYVMAQHSVQARRLLSREGTSMTF